MFQEFIFVNISSNGTVLPSGTVPPGTNFTTNATLNTNINSTAWCITYLNATLVWRANQTLTVQQYLIDKRLGDQRTTGKIASLNTVTNSLQTFMINNYPELIDPVFNLPRGSVALASAGCPQCPISARIDVLQTQYVTGVYYSTYPQVSHATAYYTYSLLLHVPPG